MSIQILFSKVYFNKIRRNNLYNSVRPTGYLDSLLALPVLTRSFVLGHRLYM